MLAMARIGCGQKHNQKLKTKKWALVFSFHFLPTEFTTEIAMETTDNLNNGEPAISSGEVGHGSISDLMHSQGAPDPHQLPNPKGAPAQPAGILSSVPAAWMGRLDKLAFLTNEKPDTAAIQRLSTKAWKTPSHYKYSWTNEIRPGVTFTVQHTPRWGSQKYHSRFEINPDRHGLYKNALSVITAVYPTCSLQTASVSTLHCTVDLPAPSHPWRELRRKTFMHGVHKVEIYNAGFALGATPKRLSVYWRLLKGVDDTGDVLEAQTQFGPDETRIELQLSEDKCSQFTLGNLHQLKFFHPFQTHGVEFWTPINVEDRTLSELDMLKVAGLVPFTDYCGSYFHLYKVLNQNGNFARDCSKLFKPCPNISAAQLDAVFSTRMKTFF